MSLRLKCALGLLALGVVGSVANLASGWGLTQSEDVSSQTHLVVAITTLISSALGVVLLMRFSDVELERAERSAFARSQSFPLQEGRSRQSAALRSAWAVLCLFPLSIITGTISHAGQWPLLHSLLGLALTAVSSFALYCWIRFSLFLNR